LQVLCYAFIRRKGERGEGEGTGRELVVVLKTNRLVLLGMRLCSDRERRRGGVWDWREGGRRLIGRGGREAAEDRCTILDEGWLEWVGSRLGRKYWAGRGNRSCARLRLKERVVQITWAKRLK